MSACLNLGNESGKNKQISMLQSQGLALISKHWVILHFCQISGESAWFRGYRAHGFMLGVHGFGATGCIVSRVPGDRVRGT